MPVQCSSSVLTGADGLVTFKPAGGANCLLDFTDFPAGTSITVPAGSDYRVGDQVVFTVAGTAKLDSGLTAGTTYHVVAAAATSIDVSASAGGSAITLTGDGGTGSADTAGSANHIEVAFAEYEAVCSVQEWSLNLSKDQTDVTTLPCAISSGAKVAPVRKQQGTFLNGEGSMSILFTSDQTALGNRLLGNSVLSDSKVMAKLYVSAVSGGATVDDASSSYFEGEVNLLGFEITVNTSDAIVATVNFSLADTPKALFGVTL